MSTQSADIPSINVTITPDPPPISNPTTKPDFHLPAINIAAAQSDSGQQTKHSRSPSDPAFLLPRNPYLESDASSSDVPPSPTLSTQSSVHFATSVALRENKPEDGTGLTSLSPGSRDRKHSRKGSSATFASSAEGRSSLDGTEADHYGQFALRHNASNATSVTVESPTDTHVDGASMMHKARSYSKGSQDIEEVKKNGKRKSSDVEEDTGGPSKQKRVELVQDEDIDPTPFAYKPYELASMLDPKNLGLLESMGGVETLINGLGTHATMGLGKRALARSETFKAKEAERDILKERRPEAGAGPASSQRHDREKNDLNVPGIVVTTPDGKAKSKSPDGEEEGPAFAATLDERRRIYGPNILPHRPSKTLLQLMWAALKDKVLILLSIAAVISLALGLFQDFGTTRAPGDPPVDWVEGVAIMVAILIVVVVGSVNDYQKERQFRSLNDKKEERGLKVMRDGVETVIDVKEVVVGDVALMEPGEIVPCDGVFLSGHNVKCDESGATGESDAIKKVSYRDCLALRNKNRVVPGEGGAGGEEKIGMRSAGGHTDCFIVSGSKVLEGVGSYVVVAVGTKSFNGRIMMALRGDTENTPLQSKLNNLAELIAKLGSIAGLALFTALMIRFFIQLGTGSPPRNPSQKGIAFVNILIISVTLIVVAVPEGLPLAVTLALAFATKRMTKEKLLVRVLGSCETMANASVVCTDKTGTLTQNVMTVVAGSVGIHAKFVRNLDENKSRTNADEKEGTNVTSGQIGSQDVVAPDAAGKRKHPDDFTLDQATINDVLSPQLCDLFNSAIAINSTAFEDVDHETGKVVFVGSKTETALLKFAKELGWKDYMKTRAAADVVQMIPFSSERKAMGVVVKMPGSKFRLHLKGASEILTKMCTRHVVVRETAKGQQPGSHPVETAEIDELASDNISRTIIFYANQALRTIALCYRDFECWPPAGARHSSEDDDVDYIDLAQDLTLIGITGIEDPLRDNVSDAVARCHKAGVAVKMCTGDNVLTARSIAIQCGIYTSGGIIMEGPAFRQLDRVQMDHVVPRLQILARSSPEDKKILVETLKNLGEIVGVTGDGTNDGPALKMAHVGFSMGIAGTEVAKEASDIILMDDNFSSIVKAIMWGRCVNDAVRKFLQFQISTNVTAVIITFVSAVASDQEQSVLSAVQLLWINIIMDTFAALALATDPATEALLDRKPDKKTAPLFSVHMYKQIFWQSIYQIIIILTFHFAGKQILGFEAHPTDSSDIIVQTLVFNAFVFAQIFNSVNCRRLDNKLNIFEGITKNIYFIVITLIEIVVQILIVFVGGAAFQVTRIGGREWGIALALGVVSIPLGALVRMMPDGPFEKLFISLRLLPNPSLLPTETPRTDSTWNPVVNTLRDNLGLFSQVRGGRLRSSSYVLKSRDARPFHDSAERPTLSGLMALLPAAVAASVGTDWKSPGSLSDPAHNDPSKSSAALWEGKIQVHPETKPDDPIFSLLGVKPNRNQER